MACAHRARRSISQPRRSLAHPAMRDAVRLAPTPSDRWQMRGLATARRVGVLQDRRTEAIAEQMPATRDPGREAESAEDTRSRPASATTLEQRHWRESQRG